MVYNNQNFQPQQFYNGQQVQPNMQQLNPLNYQSTNGYNYNAQNQQGVQGVQNIQNTQGTQNAQAQQNMNMQYQYPYAFSQGLFQNNYNQNNQVAVRNNNNQIWVQGEAGAKAYPVAAGNSIMLLDSEGNTFYIKTMDSNGVPLPLRIFDYTERVTQTTQATAGVNAMDTKNNVDIEKDYITRDEFEKRLSELNFGNKEERGNRNESTVQSSKRSEQSAKQYNKHNTTV